MKIYIILSAHYNKFGEQDENCVFRGAYQTKEKAEKELEQFIKYNNNSYFFTIKETELK